jgi:hypothetical protein
MIDKHKTSKQQKVNEKQRYMLSNIELNEKYLFNV